MKAVVQEHVSPTKLQTRHDVLHEHHKYIKSKKHENLEMKLEQVRFCIEINVIGLGNGKLYF